VVPKRVPSLHRRENKLALVAGEDAGRHLCHRGGGGGGGMRRDEEGGGGVGDEEDDVVGGGREALLSALVVW
jgi:hypothetical protein